MVDQIFKERRYRRGGGKGYFNEFDAGSDSKMPLIANDLVASAPIKAQTGDLFPKARWGYPDERIHS